MKPPKRAGDPGRGSGRQQLSNSKLGMSGVQMNPSLEATSLLHFYYLSCIQSEGVNLVMLDLKLKDETWTDCGNRSSNPKPSKHPITRLS